MSRALTAAPRLLMLLMFALLVGAFSTGLLNFVQSLYLVIGLEEGMRDYFLALYLAIGILVVLALAPFNAATKRNLLMLWTLRCVVTLILMLVYERFYVRLDAFVFYRDALNGNYRGFDLFNGTNNLILGMGTLMDWLPMLRSYQAIKVLWSLLGFVGGYCAWRGYVLATEEENHTVLWLLTAFPSIVFWSSILGKDPVVFLGIGMAIWGAVGILRHPSFVYILLFAAGVVIAGSIRMWIGICLLLPMAVALINASPLQESRFFGAKLIVIGALFVGSGVFFSKNKLLSQMDVLDRINSVSRAWSEGGSQQEVPELNTPAQILAFLPRGMFTALFRPLPGEVPNVFGLLAGLENLILLFLFWRTIRFFRPDFFYDQVAQFFVLVTVVWATLYSFLSYQNLGTAVRFKVQILPFLLIMPFFFRWMLRHDRDAHRVWGSREM